MLPEQSFIFATAINFLSSIKWHLEKITDNFNLLK